MSHFINLSSRIVNKLHIVEIIKKESKYLICMSNTKIDSFHILGSGGVESESNIIEICEKKNQEDYNNIKKFIENIKS